MSYAQYLKELLRPLGVYNLEAPFSGGELDTEGAALDGAEGRLVEVGREIDLTSARDWGLVRSSGFSKNKRSKSDVMLFPSYQKGAPAGLYCG